MKNYILFLFALTASSLTFSQELVKDIRPGQDASDIDFNNAVLHNNTLYFVANDGGMYSGLFKTDGTTAGTVKLVGNNNFGVFKLFGFIGNDLIFGAGSFTDSTGIYKTDGNSTNYTLVKNISTSFLSFLGPTIKVGNTIYFIGNDDVHGFEPWKTDGTKAGTRMIKDINPGVESSVLFTQSDDYFAALGNTVYFGAGHPDTGAELWKTDGTEAGTVLVKDIHPDNTLGANFGSNPSSLKTFKGKVYFNAYRPIDGRELWVTDGTENGTQLVKDLAPADGFPTNFFEYNNSLFFRAYANNEAYTLWRTDGTTSGTTTVKLPSAGGAELVSKLHYFKFKMAFIGIDNNGFYNIWTSDGTSSGTQKMANGNTSISAAGEHLLATSNYLYFAASNSSGDYHLYRSEGAPNTLQKLTTGNNFEVDNLQPMYLVNNCVLFVANNGNTGYELYRVCNQQTQPLSTNEVENALHLALYPNPATDAVKIVSEIEEDLLVKIYSLSGAVVAENKAVSGSLIDVKHLQSGLYIVHAISKTGRQQSLKLFID